MTPSEFIIDVNESDFEYQVLAYSQQTPVVVDFWAEWCTPCRVLGPLLERLAHEAQGNFRLAKVDVDQNQSLALRYAVRSIPAVKAFRNGQMIAEFIGVQPEPKLREFIRSIAPSDSDLLLEKGNSFLTIYQPQQAEEAFRQALSITPDTPGGLLGLAKSLLQQGEAQESLQILRDFPPSREYASAQTLLPLAQALNAYQESSYEDSDHPLDAAFQNVFRLVKRKNIEAAMDGLLDILREEKQYRDGEARFVILGLLETLGNESEVTQQYRKELASVLF